MVEVSRYRFLYQRDYGSPLMDEASPGISLSRIAPDVVKMTINEPIKRGFCYEISLGAELDSTLCYTVQELKE